MSKTKMKCGLCKGFGLVKVRKCKHCVICPHCRGKGTFDLSSSNPDGIEYLKKLVNDIEKYDHDYIAYNRKNKPPFRIIED